MHSNISIRRMSAGEEQLVFELMQREGEEWQDYWLPENRPQYERALRSSITYLLFAGAELAGFARCRDDDGYGLYIYDLLVDKKQRGQEFGRLLMEQAAADFPTAPAYVMSDVDEYYRKLGYQREGSIFIVRS